MTALSKSSLVAVIGAGAMGAGIAQVAAQAGHPVILLDATEGAAEAGRNGILTRLDKLVERGKFEKRVRDGICDRIAVAASIEDLRDARLAVEAVVEKLDVKRSIFASLENVVGTDAILATNTSSLSVTSIAAGLKHPERVAGLHFFNPAPVMKLVEVIAGLASSKQVLETLYDTAVAWEKLPVRATSTPGFIVNRVARPYYAEGLRLLEENASDVATIDAILRECGGFRMGPFELMDLIGHDVNFAVTKSVFDAFFGDPRFRPSLAQQELVAANWLGRKSGRGFYDYNPEALKPEIQALGAGVPVNEIVVEGRDEGLEPLVNAAETSGMRVIRREGEGFVRVAGAAIAITDGRTATERAAKGGPKDLVVYDLTIDFGKASRVALSKADQCSKDGLQAAASLFQSLGKQVSVVDDTPALVVLRTVAMLVNEAADAVLCGVATPVDIDRAMTLGVNYPRGPLAWGDAIGPARILSALEALHAGYGDDRYRPSRHLRRIVQSGLPLVPNENNAPNGERSNWSAP